jgi:site-specific DNA-methyltransferase (adenine-specific)
MNGVHYSKNTDEWATPVAIFEELDEEFHFTLDAAADRTNAKCAHFFTKDDDGLRQPWSGTVWCNPPYSQLKSWVAKAWRERKSGVTSVLLIPARTDTIAFHEYIWQQPGVEIRFLRGRLQFSGRNKDAPFPSMVVIFHLCCKKCACDESCSHSGPKNAIGSTASVMQRLTTVLPIP